MAQHEMRDPSENRSVIRQIDSAFYRVAWGGIPGEGDVTLPGGFIGTPRSPVSHFHDRTGSVERPVVRVTQAGRAYHTWYDTAGRFRIAAVA